jgi:beta-mannanase
VPIYWGAYIDGSTYDATWGDAPWDERSITAFEKNAGKAVSIIEFGQAWQANNGSMNAFDPVPYTLTREHGAIPLINWNPWQSCCGVNQPTWRLANIINGRYDDYITRWATGARNWDHPLFLRIMDEMNGNWYPWSEGVNGNQSGQFVQAWRHIRDIFTSVGATNVIWVWNPNTEYDGSLPLERLYPGDDYVDWVGMTGFNFGPTARGDVWLSFATLFGPLYDHLGQVAPSKPVMICETASTEKGGSKADWITDALVTELPARFTRVKAIVWFNWTAEGHDWYIESSPSAQAAFAKAIASPYFAANTLGDLDAAP